MHDEDTVERSANVELNRVSTLGDRQLERCRGVSGSIARCATVRDDEGQEGAVGHPDRMTVRDPPVRPAADREDLQ